MTEQGQFDLTIAMRTIAAELQRACIVKTGMNRVQCPSSDRRMWASPALKPNGEFSGISLNDLSRCLYSGERIADPINAWDQAVTMLYATGKTHTTVTALVPTLPMPVVKSSASAPLLHLLCALWWQGGKLEVTQSSAFLRTKGQRIGLDQRVAVYQGEQCRLPPRLRVVPSIVLGQSVGRPKLALAETTAVYRHLLLTFPGMAAKLDVIFMTAVTAGRQFEKILTELFFLIPTDDIDLAGSDIWANARSIVAGATKAPGEPLWTLLRGTVSYVAFTKAFGVPRDRGLKHYSTLMRTRHLEAIDKFESGEVDTAVKKKMGDPAAAANSLLQLQTMMGSWK